MRQKDLPSAFLFLLIVGVASLRLAVTQWISDLGLVMLLTALGTALGLALGYSSFQRRGVATLILFYTTICHPFTLAGFLMPGKPWLERMSLLGIHLADAVGILAAGEPLKDTFLLIFLFTFGFWLIGISSGYWFARKGSFLGATLPSGIVMLILLFFDTQSNSSTILTITFVFLLVLLLGRMNYARRRDGWRGWMVFPTEESRKDLNLGILFGTIILVIVAWVVPVSPQHIPFFRDRWREISRLWQRNDNVNNLFAGLEPTGGSGVNVIFYGPYMSLGKDAPLGNTLLFHAENTGSSRQERYYWRIRSYDSFSDGIWGTSFGKTLQFNPSSPPLQLPDAAGGKGEFVFTVVATKLGALVTPPRPLWVDLPSRLIYFPISEKLVEPIIFLPAEAVSPGIEYQVQFSILEPTQRQLREAGTGYPEWVTKYYLQLPSTLSPSISNLAKQITRDAATPFDKAEAITAYLRKNITYTTRMETPPDGRNVLTWFLFNYKQGFCNYYATAEVILLRASGVPARLAVGFSEGEYEMPGWYTVRQKNVHAWPEVYFPGLGWVEFEPTSSEPEIVRPRGDIITTESETPEPTPLAVLDEEIPGFPGEDDNQAVEETTQTLPHNWLNPIISLLTLMYLSSLVVHHITHLARTGKLNSGYQRFQRGLETSIWLFVGNWLKKNALPIPRWLEKKIWMAGLSPLERIFNQVYRTLRVFNPNEVRTLTPSEAAEKLIAHLPEARENIITLLEEYEPATYGIGTPNVRKVQAAVTSLRKKACRKQVAAWFTQRGKRKRARNKFRVTARMRPPE